MTSRAMGSTNNGESSDTPDGSAAPESRHRSVALYEALGAVAGAAAGLEGVDALYAATCDALRNLAGFDAVSIRRADDDGQWLVPVAWHGWGQGALTRYELPGPGDAVSMADDALVGPLVHPTARSFLERRSIYTADYQAEPSLRQYWERARAHGVHALVATPLWRGDEVVGTLTVGSAKPHAFDDEDRALIERIAKTLSAGLASREAMRRLADSEARFRRLNAIAADWIWETDDQMRLTYISPSYYDKLGAAAHAVLGSVMGTMDHPEDDPRQREAYKAALADRRPFRDYEYARDDADGRRRWRSLSGEPVFDASGTFVGFQGTCRDVTDRKNLEAELKRQASHDALTGLPNRSLLDDRLAHALARVGRSGGALAVMLIDLDEFKHVNDSMGHSAGDQLLVEVAARLKRCVRTEDTVARLGGDEFVAVVEVADVVRDLPDVAQRILDAVALPMTIGTQEVAIGASLGIAVHVRDGRTAGELLRNADAAMYQVKAGGRNGFSFYTEALNQRAQRHVTLRTALRRALERGEFELHYQPIVACDDGVLHGAEALIRWRDEAGRLVPPGDFLDVAEESGLIVQIGAWVLRRACAQAREWLDAGWQVPVSVNVSAQQFRDEALVELVRAALRGSGLPSSMLTLEVTESTVMSDMDRTVAVLAKIDALGVATSIDDFGTGHSSLAYLKRFPVRSLKIDRSFVAQAHQRADDAAIVRAVVDLSHALGKRVVAEGVEADAQVTLLRELGCERMQGFLLGRPVPAGDFAAHWRLEPSSG